VNAWRIAGGKNKTTLKSDEQAGHRWAEALKDGFSSAQGLGSEGGRQEHKQYEDEPGRTFWKAFEGLPLELQRT
jgi:hypothetical protein